MFKVTTIVVPTDFSKVSKSAFDHARVLAEKMGASIHLIHVLDCNPPFTTSKSSDYPESEMMKVIENEAMKKLDETADQINQETELKVTKILLKGRDYEEIVNYAKNVNADLIIIATHARTGILLSLLGSVAENVIRNSHCPVLVIKPQNII
jgi:universal stress protein A